ncbi:uncharacterized protein LOC110623391 isoform X2 [Manihot esculenta]|uniref:uncharacterized protein LOC110623391 isoform X2 n=1 Tax=Manihot esculenta TaxID=3983 RepID=UPI001CC606A8|nr:uncharacterized protein LOC110623391 isoform X2 [Manihot esculenta]
MGIDAARIGLHIRRIFIVSIRTSYKSVLKHPVLVGLVCFLIFLYRSFPFLFSLLVSASPVLFCTVILLGTLLSFGEPNIPEIEKANKEVSHEISSLKAGVLGDATTVLEKDENIFVENFVGKRKDAAEEAIGEENWEKNRVSKIERDVGSCDYVQLVDGSSQDIKFEKQVIEQVERDFGDLELEKNREFYKEKQGIKVVLTNGEAIENHCSLVQNVGDETLQVKKDKSAGGFIAAEKGHHLDHELSSWKQVNDDDEEEEEEKEDDDEASDPGSDGAESSSPDASMADIMPMLDELHPLLDEEAPQPAPVSHDGSDAASKRSNRSNESSVGSEDDIENEADEEDGDDDNDNEEDEEVQEGKEDESKSAIKWTEADQKNLMDLGTLELERNQRLESLIARRRARRNMSLVAERNLIDLDGADLPLNVPPISTMRRNPFDVPYDDVPGSAPSVLLPRRNPFDLPYDSNEEKPDLKGDSFQQEFSPLQHREPLFCRHESFSVGPSVWGGAKQHRQALRWKPYFVPERLDSEETSYHALQRQLSEASESKISSVLDTESVSSAVEEEDKKLNEDLSQETEMISNLNHASVLVERGSLSSEDIDSVDIENIERRDVHNDGKEITLGDAENHPELDSSLSASGGATGIELNTSVILLRMEPGEEEYSSRSSPSSQSEVDEKISGVRKRSMSPDPGKSQIEESHISTQASLDSAFHFMGEVVGEIQEKELVMNPRGNDTAKDVTAMQMSFDSDIHFTSGVEDENRHIEPGFESTGDPIEDSRILTLASSDSDSHFKIVVLDNDQQEEPVLEPSGNLIRKSCISIQTSLNSDFHFTSDPVDDNQQKDPVYDSSPHAVEKFLSFSSISSDTQGETSEMGSPPALAEFSGKESEVHTENIGKDTSCQKEAYEGSSKEHSLFENESSSRKVAETEPDVAKVGQLGDNQVLDFQSGENGFMKSELVVERDASEDTVLHALEEQHPLVGDVSVDSKLFSSESKSVEEDVLRMKGISQPEQEEVPSSGFDAEVHSNSSVSSSFEHMPSNDLNLSENDERQPVVVAGQVLEAHPNASSSKIKHVEELSLMKGEDFQFKQDQVHSSSSDAMIGTICRCRRVNSGSEHCQQLTCA